MTDTTLSTTEIERVTGYKRPADQLEELKRQGFYRARRSPTSGSIILERAHYSAVCEGAKPSNEPRVRPPAVRQLRAA